MTPLDEISWSTPLPDAYRTSRFTDDTDPEPPDYDPADERENGHRP